MSRSNSARNAAAVGPILAAALLAGCSWTGSLFPSDKVQYETAQTRQPLEVPPDLSQLPRDERFLVPDKPQTITASGQGQRASPGLVSASSPVVPTGSIAKIERLGTQRWLAVNLPPEKAWPVLVDFWPSIGLKVEKADANAGVLETNWAENRAKLPQDIIRRTLGRVLDSVYSTNEQDKYRARLERTAQGTSEIYIAHRGMEEVYASPQQDRTIWQPRAPDPDLEAEMLQRLLVRFEDPAKSVVATAPATGSATSTTAAGAAAPSAAAPSAASQISRLIKGSDGRSERVEVDEAFDRAWRRVGLALDRGGFTVEDRDRAKGFYFVRYLDPEFEAKAKSDQGFFSKIFGKEKPIQAPQYRIALVGESTVRTNVQVFDSTGKPERSPTVDRILSLLNEQLR